MALLVVGDVLYGVNGMVCVWWGKMVGSNINVALTPLKSLLAFKLKALVAFTHSGPDFNVILAPLRP